MLNVQFGWLVRQGVICRYVPGRYGLPDGVAAEDLVASIDPDAYATAASAAARHGLITQVSQVIECFTRRRHNRSGTRSSPLGRLVFRCVSAAIHDRPEIAVAGSAQALCDLVYLAHRAGTDPRSMYTFRKLASVALPANLVDRYPKTVQADVVRLVSEAGGLYVAAVCQEERRGQERADMPGDRRRSCPHDRSRRLIWPRSPSGYGAA